MGADMLRWGCHLGESYCGVGLGALLGSRLAIMLGHCSLLGYQGGREYNQWYLLAPPTHERIPDVPPLVGRYSGVSKSASFTHILVVL